MLDIKKEKVMTLTKEQLTNYTKLANAAYSAPVIVDSWHPIPIKGEEITSSLGSFNGICYGRDKQENGSYNEVVVVFRGSQEALDWIPADFLILLNWKPSTQLGAARDFFANVLDEPACQGADITLVGHSLGGALVQLVATETGHKGVTFNAPGMAKFKKQYSNITNYVAMNDYVGCHCEHIGETWHYLPEGKINGGYLPHSCYKDVDELQNKTFKVDEKKWTHRQACALINHDVNNTNGSKLYNGLSKSFKLVADIEDAVDILKDTFCCNNKAARRLVYKTSSKYYVLGTNSDDAVLGYGKDIIHGVGGNDTIKSLEGDDTLYGDSGDDSLYGGTGKDILYGGNGNDYLQGGTGKDMYIIKSTDIGIKTIRDNIGWIEYWILQNSAKGTYKKVHLKRADRKEGEENIWRDKYGLIYSYIGDSNDLSIAGSIIIKDFKNGNLGITLYQPDGTEEPPYHNGNNSGEGGEGSGGGSGDGSGGGDEGQNPGETAEATEKDKEEEKKPSEHPADIFDEPKPNTPPDETITEAGPPNTPPVDPLIFDLDFDGVISLSKPENGRNFDIDNDGIAQKVAWINSGDAILVCDRNGNGTIDNGLELFGDNTLLENGEYAKSGIEALAEFDTNKDGKITLADLKFSDLKLLKSDNTTITLEEAGIKEIGLSYTTVNKTDANGNRQIKEAKFITNDDVEHIYGEFMLNQNIYQSVSAEMIEESEEVAALPDVSGSGLVHSLHQTIMRDVSGEILAALKAFLNEENIDTKHSLCEQLIYKWAGTENITTTGRGTLFDGRKLATIEAFAGTYLQGSPKTPVRTQAAADILEEGFDNFFGFVYSSLAIQTHMSELFSNLSYKLDKNDKWKVNLDGTFPVIEKYMRECEEKAWEELEAALEDTEAEGEQTEDTTEFGIEVDYTPVYDMISDLVYVLKYFNYLKALDWQKYVTEYNVRFGNNVGYILLKHIADYPGTKGNDSIHGDSRNNILYGDEGNDTLYGYYGHDTLYGGDGNDSLRGAWGNDVLYAGRGNDTLDGYEGDDTYIINPAEINGASYTKIDETKGNDTVIFQGVNSDEITAQSNNQGTIYISFTNYPDNKIEIPYQNDTAKRIETFIFEDVTLTFDEFKNKYLA